MQRFPPHHSHPSTCSHCRPIASAIFFKVVGRVFVSAASILAKLGWLMPIRLATSFCDRPKYSRHARTKDTPPRMESLFTSHEKGLLAHRGVHPQHFLLPCVPYPRFPSQLAPTYHRGTKTSLRRSPINIFCNIAASRLKRLSP